MYMGKTMFEKIWTRHIVAEPEDQPALIYIDLHLVHEVTSPQAFESLRLNNRKVRRPDLTISTVDHNLPTDDTRSEVIKDPIARIQVDTLRKNCEEMGVTLYDVDSAAQGIVHVIGPEQGYTQPGMTIVWRRLAPPRLSPFSMVPTLTFLAGRTVSRSATSTVMVTSILLLLPSWTTRLPGMKMMAVKTLRNRSSAAPSCVPPVSTCVILRVI